MSPIKMKFHMDMVGLLAQQLTNLYGSIQQTPLAGRPDEVMNQISGTPYQTKTVDGLTRKLFITSVDGGFVYTSLFVESDWIQGVSYTVKSTDTLEDFQQQIMLLEDNCKMSLRSTLKGKFYQNLLSLFD